MKKSFRTAVAFAWVGLLATPCAFAQTLTFQTSISGDEVPVTVRLVDAPEGNAVDVQVSIPPGSGDLLGFFGNVAADELASDAAIVADMSVVDPTGLVTGSSFAANAVDKVGPGNNVLPAGGWDFGLRLGENGAKAGPVTAAGFRLVAPGLTAARLTTADTGGWILGVRIQSTGGPEGSAKVGLAAGAPSIEVSSPSSGAFLGATPVTVRGEVGGTAVRVDVNGVPASIDGASFTASVELPEGAAVLRATAVNDVGTASVSVPVTVDLTPPVVTLTAPAEGALTGDAEIAVRGSVDDSSPLQRVDVAGSELPSPASPFSATAPVELGENVVRVSAVDAAGNVGSAERTVLRGSPPVIRIDAPAGGEVVRVPQIEVRGQVGSDTQAVTVDGLAARLDADGSFSAVVPVAEGEATIAVDAVNRFGTAGARVTVERRTPPRVEITSPGMMARFVASPVEVRGTVDDPGATVRVNGVPASVSAGTPATFLATVPVAEGRSFLTAQAVDGDGEIGVTTVPVVLDTSPPHLAVAAPADGAVIDTPTVDVTGVVNDVTLGRVDGPLATVEVNGVAAVVHGRDFLAAGVPLELGTNVLTIEAVDVVGNRSATSLSVERRDLAGQAHIQALAGNGQTGPIASVLHDPLVVELLDTEGTPVTGATVIFKVTENSGLLTAGGRSGRAVAVATDALGLASAFWSLGTRAGAGNQRVEATAVGFAGRAEFTASATPGAPAKLILDSGNHQRGLVEQPLPRPLVVVVTDQGNNRLAGVPVTFRVTEGGGSFAGGEDHVTIPTDGKGTALTQVRLGPVDGVESQVVVVDFDGNPGVPVKFLASSVLPGDAAQTRLSGIVLDYVEQPISGATVELAGTGLVTRTDAQGQFSFAPAPVGSFKLHVDGSTVDRPGTWPSLAYDVVTIPGRDNDVGTPIYLLPLDLPNGLLVDETHGGTLNLPQLPGFALTILPGSATFPGGVKRGVVSVTPVHNDKVPMSPNFGQQPRLIVTIQPTGVHFDPPAALTLPNVDGLVPGEVTDLYSFDHELGRFISIGPATVSEDGLLVRSNPGIGILQGGWHCGGDPAAQGACCECGMCEQCDPSQGTCTPQTGASCDDGKFCTSFTGTEPGPDQCKDGACLGNEIEDKDRADLTPEEYDLTELRKILKGVAESSRLVPGCEVSDPSVSGGMKLTFFQRCCEDLQAVKLGTKLSGFVNVDIAGIECVIPGLSFTILDTFDAGVFVGASFSGGFSGSGENAPCNDECRTAITGKLGAALKGGLKIQTIFDPSLLSVKADVKGGGEFSVSLKCGDVSAEGCLGPPSVEGELVLAGFIKKSFEFVPFPDLKVCLP